MDVLCVTGHSTNSLCTWVRLCVSDCHLKIDLFVWESRHRRAWVHVHIHIKSRRGCQFTLLESLPGSPVCILLAVCIPHRAWVTGVPGACYLDAGIKLLTTDQLLWTFPSFFNNSVHHFLFIFVCMFMYLNTWIGCVCACARRDQKLVAVTSLITLYLVCICIEPRAHQFR